MLAGGAGGGGRRRRDWPRALLGAPCTARQALAVVVVAGHLPAVPVEDDQGAGMPPALRARVTERVRREVGRLDGRGGHRGSSTTGRIDPPSSSSLASR